MPCYEPRPAELLDEANRKINKLTDMLCRMCTQRDELREEIDRNQVIVETPVLDSDISDWWIRHTISDNYRKERDKSNEHI